MSRLVNITAVACLALAVSIAAGCAREPDESKGPQDTPAPSASDSSTVIASSPSAEPDQPVQVTFPAWYFNGATEAQIREAASGEGYDSAVVNTDGSVTYTMKEAKRVAVLDELERDVPDIVAGLTQGSGAVAAFVSVDHSADFTEFTVVADAAKYSELDGLWANALLMAGTNLQAFRGIPANSNRVTIRIVDIDSGRSLLSVDSAALK